MVHQQLPHFVKLQVAVMGATLCLSFSIARVSAPLGKVCDCAHLKK
jgi:hypothetical protein